MGCDYQTGLDSFRDPRIATFSASEGLGKDAVTGVLASQDSTIWIANSGSLDHIVNGSVSSIRAGNGLPGHQVASMMEDRAGNFWVGVDDGLYLFKNGGFRRLPEPNHQPLGLVVGLTRGHRRKYLGRVRGQCSKASSHSRFPGSRRAYFVASPTGPHAGARSSRRNLDRSLEREPVRFRHGALENFPLQATGNRVSHQIIAEPDGSVLRRIG